VSAEQIEQTLTGRGRRMYASLVAAKGLNVAGPWLEALAAKHLDAAELERQLRGLCEWQKVAVDETAEAPPPEPPPPPSEPEQLHEERPTGRRRLFGGRQQNPKPPATRKRYRSEANGGDLPPHLEGGYGTVSNRIVYELIADMPAPVLRAYVLAACLADVDGTFFCSHQKLAEKIGVRRRETARRAIQTLVAAGLIQPVEAGRTGRACTYQFSALRSLDIAAARAALRAASGKV
jgi:hypothetical protein